MKRKNTQKRKLKSINLSQIKSQPVSNSPENAIYQEKGPEIELNTVINQESYKKVCIEQNEIENEKRISLSHKEHIILVGIGTVFSIILYLVSFLV